MDVRWFQLWLDPAFHPWAFKYGDPSRRIAALDMLRTLTYHLLARRDSGLLHLPLELVTDNRWNVSSLRSGKSREFPCSAFLMQIVLLLYLYEAGAHMCPSHRKRGFNRWAEELTHPNPHGFSAGKQLDILECLKSFSLLPAILPQWLISP